MYGREYNGNVLNFEASGGLIHASLVMQDQETDTYWSLMKGRAIGGRLKGTELEELAVGKKARWKDWVEEHPDTLVLSVAGNEDLPFNPYSDYLESSKTFGGQEANVLGDVRGGDRGHRVGFGQGGPDEDEAERRDERSVELHESLLWYPCLDTPRCCCL